MTKRWPTLLGLLTSAVGLYVIFAQNAGVEFASSVAAMALMYMMTFAWGKPAMIWVAAPVSITLLVLLEVLDTPVSTVAGLLIALLLAWIAAIVRGQVKTGKWFTIETAGMAGFGAMALAAVLVDVKLGGVLAGLGFLAHGLWDAFHYAKNRVVARSFAEYCAVVDVIIGVTLPIAVLTA